MIACRAVAMLALALALSACKSESRTKAAVGGPTPSSPKTPAGAPDPGTGLAPGATAASCTPAAPHQRPGTATVTVRGDGVELTMTDGPAVCGALHLVETKRFQIGDGTLFRACLPDGSSVAISSDVALTGTVDPRFKYENYKKTGPLLEYTRPGVGTYNQREEPEGDKLFIGYERERAELTTTLVWPSKADRTIAVTATFACAPPTP